MAGILFFLMQIGQWGEETDQWVGGTVGWGLDLSAAFLILSCKKALTLPFAKLILLNQWGNGREKRRRLYRRLKMTKSKQEAIL